MTKALQAMVTGMIAEIDRDTMRAALYARYSSQNQDELSVADQLALCRRYAAQLGADVAAEFSDDETQLR